MLRVAAQLALVPPGQLAPLGMLAVIIQTRSEPLGSRDSKLG